MLVTVGIGRCADGRMRIEVQRPQACARAEKSYADAQAVAAVLSNFGIPQNTIEYFVRLLPDLDINHVLTFPPMHVSSHQLTCADFRIAAAASGPQ